ncbi:MAG: PilZ domain-containing protein [Acidobacteria bacterium]|nr:PilZ domain-containing protein [Acidobacteriota bacterium]
MPFAEPVPPVSERRRTARRPIEPLSVRLGRNRHGICVDLSASGALVQLPVAPPTDRQFTARFEWNDTIVALQARVMRSVGRAVRLESATLARTEYSVGLEFVDPTPKAVGAIQQIMAHD